MLTGWRWLHFASFSPSTLPRSGSFRESRLVALPCPVGRSGPLVGIWWWRKNLAVCQFWANAIVCNARAETLAVFSRYFYLDGAMDRESIFATLQARNIHIPYPILTLIALLVIRDWRIGDYLFYVINEMNKVERKLFIKEISNLRTRWRHLLRVEPRRLCIPRYSSPTPLILVP